MRNFARAVACVGIASAVFGCGEDEGGAVDFSVDAPQVACCNTY